MKFTNLSITNINIFTDFVFFSSILGIDRPNDILAFFGIWIYLLISILVLWIDGTYDTH